MGVKIYANGRRYFRPFLIQHRLDPRWEATVRAEALRLEGVSAPSNYTEIKNAL